MIPLRNWTISDDEDDLTHEHTDRSLTCNEVENVGTAQVIEMPMVLSSSILRQVAFIAIGR